jgi:hypothetical protein
MITKKEKKQKETGEKEKEKTKWKVTDPPDAEDPTLFKPGPGSAESRNDFIRLEWAHGAPNILERIIIGREKFVQRMSQFF